MAETALYKKLENYNSTIENKYKDNWGSLLTYFDNTDTKLMVKLANSKGMDSVAERSTMMAKSPVHRQINQKRTNRNARGTISANFQNPIQRYADEISRAQSGHQAAGTEGWNYLMGVSQVVSRTGTAVAGSLRDSHNHRLMSSIHETPITANRGTRNGRIFSQTGGAFGLNMDVMDKARKGMQTNSVGTRADIRKYLKSSNRSNMEEQHTGINSVTNKSPKQTIREKGFSLKDQNVFKEIKTSISVKNDQARISTDVENNGLNTYLNQSVIAQPQKVDGIVRKSQAQQASKCQKVQYNQQIRELFTKPEVPYNNDSFVYFPQKKSVNFDLQMSKPKDQSKYSTKGAPTSLHKNIIIDQKREQKHRIDFITNINSQAQHEHEVEKVEKSYRDQKWRNPGKNGLLSERQERLYQTIDSGRLYRHVSPRTKSQFQDESTAFGFPTIHRQSVDTKRRIWNKAGVPGDNSGEHTRILENEKLLPKENYIQNCYQICKHQIIKEKTSDEKSHSCKPENKENDINKINNQMQENRSTFGVRNHHKKFSKLDEQAKKKFSQGIQKDSCDHQHLFINADMKDGRIQQFMGRRRLFADGQSPGRYLSDQRQQKWIQSRKSHGAEGKNKEAMNRQRQRQRKYIEIAKNLFLIWDSDGEGSLQPDELIKAFVNIGLSHDHHFAKMIMYSIKPQSQNKQTSPDEVFEIKMRDFITIFRNDEVSDNVIKMINSEVKYRKKQEIKELKRQVVEDQKLLGIIQHGKRLTHHERTCLGMVQEHNENENRTGLRDNAISVSMRSEIQSKNGQRQDYTVEIPLDVAMKNQIKISIDNKSSSANEQIKQKTFLIRENNQLEPQNEQDDWFANKDLALFKAQTSPPQTSQNQTALTAVQGEIKNKEETLKHLPTFGEQTDIIKDWWDDVKETYIEFLLDSQPKHMGANQDNKKTYKDFKNLQNVSLTKVYEFLIKKRLVLDRQSATKLLATSLGGTENLQNPGMMCYEEFNKLFCKGMFKVALIHTLEKLQSQGQSNSQQEVEKSQNQKCVLDQEEHNKKQDALLNFYKEMPLSLKIERYQRNKILNGLDPAGMPNQKEEVKQILQSLKYIQKFEENVDEATQMLRDRSYDDFVDDPTGANLAYMQERERKLREMNHFAQRIAFLEDTNIRHDHNQPVSMGKEVFKHEIKMVQENLKAARQAEADAARQAELGLENEIQIQAKPQFTKKGILSQFHNDQKIREVDADEAKSDRDLKSDLARLTIYQTKEKQKAANIMGIEDDPLLQGVVNNEVMIPNSYFETSEEQRIKDKGALLDKFSKLMASDGKEWDQIG